MIKIILKMLSEIFKAYDVRGIYPKELNEESAFNIGRAFADYMNAWVILLGRDMRLSSDSLFISIVKGITSQGIDVIDIGVVSTPMSYFACAFLKADGSIMITASHNPKDYNGFKVAIIGIIANDLKTLISNSQNLEVLDSVEITKNIVKDKCDVINLVPANVSLQQALALISPGARLEGVGKGLLQATLKAKGYDVPPDVLNEAVLETWARLIATERNFEKIQAVERQTKTAEPEPAAAPEPDPVSVAEAPKDAPPEPTPSPSVAAPAPVAPPAEAEADAEGEGEDGDDGVAAWIAERSAELAAKSWPELKDEFRAATGRGVKHETKPDVIAAIATAQAREAGLLPQE